MSRESLTPKASEPPSAQTFTLKNPYVGLRPFGEGDREKFHGRSKLTKDIVSKISQNSLLTIYGQSGTGKTSLIRVGVIPAFREQFPNARVISFRPDQNPFFSLSHALLASGLSYKLAAMASDTSSKKFREVHEAAGNPTEPWLIVIDPFEEIFTLPAREDLPIIHEFIQSVIDIPRQPIASVHIILAIRKDFMARLSEFNDLSATITPSLIHITTPEREDLTQIVEKPAAARGVRFEPNLVAQIVSQAEACPRWGLPLLQYTLERLWELEKAGPNGNLQDRKIGLATYHRLGGVEGALNTRMAEVYKKRTPREMHQIRSILLTMVDLADSDPGPSLTALPATLDQLQQIGKIGSTALIQQLLKERILTKSEDGKIVEFAHDCLLFAWDTLANWIREEHQIPETEPITEIPLPPKIPSSKPLVPELAGPPENSKSEIRNSNFSRALFLVVGVVLFGLFAPPSLIGLKDWGDQGIAITYWKKFFAKKEAPQGRAN